MTSLSRLTSQRPPAVTDFPPPRLNTGSLLPVNPQTLEHAFLQLCETSDQNGSKRGSSPPGGPLENSQSFESGKDESRPILAVGAGAAEEVPKYSGIVLLFQFQCVVVDSAHQRWNTDVDVQFCLFLQDILLDILVVYCWVQLLFIQIVCLCVCVQRTGRCEPDTFCQNGETSPPWWSKQWCEWGDCRGTLQFIITSYN